MTLCLSNCILIHINIVYIIIYDYFMYPFAVLLRFIQVLIHMMLPCSYIELASSHKQTTWKAHNSFTILVYWFLCKIFLRETIDFS